VIDENDRSAKASHLELKEEVKDIRVAQNEMKNEMKATQI